MTQELRYTEGVFVQILSRAYRAIYQVKVSGQIEFISVEEVNRHEY